MSILRVLYSQKHIILTFTATDYNNHFLKKFTASDKKVTKLYILCLAGFLMQQNESVPFQKCTTSTNTCVLVGLILLHCMPLSKIHYSPFHVSLYLKKLEAKILHWP
jgi:hypothetical protein